MPTYEIDHSTTWGGLPSPQGWHIIDGIYVYDNPNHPRCGHVWERMKGYPLRVWEDVSVKGDGKRWLHVSLSRRNQKMPTWEDMQEVKKLFIGEDRECYQVFPSKERYVNLGNVLHLWCCLDQPDGVLPHFERVINGQLHIFRRKHD
jgi:hypothetical protein